MSYTSQSAGSVPSDEWASAIQRCIDELIAAAADPDHSASLLGEALAQLQQALDQVRTSCSKSQHELEERQRAEQEREALIELLRILNTSEDTRTMMASTTALLSRVAECEAVGIRLREGEDFPYFETRGFSAEFVQAENRLCAANERGELIRNSDGNPVLECMCGNILCSRFDPAKPFFTANGSFWTNSTSELLSSTTDADRQTRTRNRCHGEGYESVALLPLRAGGTTFGLLQLNDRRRGRFTPEKIAMLERFSGNLAIGLAQRRTEEALRESEERYRTVAEFTYDWETWIGPSGELRYCSPACERITGYRAEEFVHDPDLLAAIVHPDDQIRAASHFSEKPGTPGDSYETEYRIRTRSGEERWIAHACQEVRGRDGAYLGRRGSNRDITGRKRTECINAARLRLLRFAATHSLDELLEATLNEAEELTGSLIGFCHFLEADQRTLSLQNWSTRTKAEFCTAEGKGVHYDVSAAGVWVDCIHERRPIIHNDYASLPHRRGLPPGHAPVVRELVVPVFRGDKIVAIVGVGNKPHDYGAEDVEAISLLADLAWEVAERKRAEEALRISEERHRTAQAVGHVGNWEYNLQTTGFWGSDEAKRIYGFDPQVDRFSTDEVESCIPGREWVHQALVDLIEKGKPYNLEFEINPKNSSKSTIVSSIAELHRDEHGKPVKVVGVIQDITKRKRAEDEIRRVNRALRVLSDCNQAVIRAADEAELLIAVCGVVVESGEYQAAWVGYIEEDAARSVRPVAQAGFEVGVLEALEIAWADTERGQGTISQAIHTNLPVTASQSGDDPVLALWEAGAGKGEPVCSLSLPLFVDGKPLGAMNIYSRAPEAFDAKEVGLLSEMAGDLAYGVETLRTRAAHARAEADLRLFRRLTNRSNDAIFVIEPQTGRVLDVNDTAGRVLGYPREELLGLRVSDFDPVMRDSSRWAEHLQTVRDAGTSLLESTHQRKDGTTFPVEVSVSFAVQDEKDYLIAVVRDIVERKHVERERLASAHFLESMDRVNRAIQENDDLGQMMSAVLDVVLSVLDCDRAALVHPCDPDAQSWTAPMERFRPPYEGVLALGLQVPMNDEVAFCHRQWRCSDSPVAFGQGHENPMPDGLRERFQIRTQLGVAIYPKDDRPWLFVIHQCSRDRVWTAEDKGLFEAIGRRLADALTSLLSHRNLRASEQRFRALVEQAADPFFLLDHDGRLLDVNQSACDALGYSREELLASNIADVDVEVEGHRHKDRFWNTLRPGEAATFEGLHRRKDGSTFPVEVHLGALELGGSKLLLGLTRDITAHRQAEVTLRAIADYTYDWESWLAPDGRLIWVNPAVEKLTGYSPTECREMPDYPLPIVHEEDRVEFSERLRKAVFERSSANDLAFRITCRDGSVRWMAVSWQPIYNERGEHTGLRASVRDITDRRKAEEEKERLTAQLYQAQKMEAVGQLAGGVAHDFNNLLTVIVGHAELMEPSLAGNAGARRSLEGIMEAARQASGVTRSLLTFSSRVPIEKERVEFRKLVQKTVHLLRRMIPAAISLATDPPDQPPVWLYADRTQLQQVIMNLAVNARDAMPDGGTLRIGVAELSGEAAQAGFADSEATELTTDRIAQLIISDTGTGMAPEIRDRVFEPFFTTKPREQGTGLGLAIVHGIVKEHGGCIGIDSAPGKGTTFTISLPIIEAQSPDEAEAPGLCERHAQGELVLVAEDNWNVRSVVATVLQKSGFQVIEAADGAALMERFAKRLGEIRLLIVDVDLPKRSGLECLREIRTQGANTPAIVVTGGTETATKSDWDRHTVLLRKPFNMSKLRQLAIDVVSGHHDLETKK